MFLLFLFALPLLLVVLAALAALVFVITLPFRILGLVMRLLFGSLALLLPLAPLLLLAGGVIWLFRRGGRRPVHA